jgi:hypothetical protein
MTTAKYSGLNGMSGPFSYRAPADCERCCRQTEGTWPWHGWKALRRAWFGVIAFLLLLSPVYFSDMYVMVPAALAIVAAIGPLNGLAAIAPTCLECGAVVERRRS